MVYVNFPTGIKELPIANIIPIGFEQNSYRVLTSDVNLNIVLDKYLNEPNSSM